MKTEDVIALMAQCGAGPDDQRPIGDDNGISFFEKFAAAVSGSNAAEMKQLRSSLERCLDEAEGWMDEARGCKPDDVMGYDGWADEARRLLGKQ